MNLNFGNEIHVDNDNDDGDVYLGQGKHRIPRVSYDKEKNNGDMSSIDIYKAYLDDDEQDDDDDDDDDATIPFDSEHRRPKLDR
jgi:hypothetical protein